jgi:hypothetical protein
MINWSISFWMNALNTYEVSPLQRDLAIVFRLLEHPSRDGNRDDIDSGARGNISASTQVLNTQHGHQHINTSTQSSNHQNSLVSTHAQASARTKIRLVGEESTSLWLTFSWLEHQDFLNLNEQDPHDALDFLKGVKKLLGRF